MNVDLSAKITNAAAFFDAYTPGDDFTVFKGDPLLLYALSNTKIPDLYEMADVLLDRHALIEPATAAGNSALHCLVIPTNHTADDDVRIARQLIARGADPNAANSKDPLAFFCVLNMPFTDEEREPLYDVWLSRTGSDVTTVCAEYGLSPLTAAQGLPYHQSIAERMYDDVGV